MRKRAMRKLAMLSGHEAGRPAAEDRRQSPASGQVDARRRAPSAEKGRATGAVAADRWRWNAAAWSVRAVAPERPASACPPPPCPAIAAAVAVHRRAARDRDRSGGRESPDRPRAVSWRRGRSLRTGYTRTAAVLRGLPASA